MTGSSANTATARVEKNVMVERVNIAVDDRSRVLKKVNEDDESYHCIKQERENGFWSIRRVWVFDLVGRKASEGHGDGTNRSKEH